METLKSSLFDKSLLNGRKLNNRLAVAPMTRHSATAEGIPTEEMAQYYANFAKGGFGLIITEGTYTDDFFSRTDQYQPGIVNDMQVNAWANVVDQVHAHDALIIAQLMHGGAFSQYIENTIAPSAVQPIGDFFFPRKMNADDFYRVKEGYIKAAIQAQIAGFDGIEIHAANGYLFDQFITEHANQRTDQYGGHVRNRLRFLMEVFQAVKEVSPSKFIVGIRMSESKVNDLTYRWPGGSETATEIFEVLSEIEPGYLHIAAEGGRWDRECLYPDGLSSTGIAKKLTGVPIIANGGMHDVQLAESLISSNQADLVSIGRAAIANPDWPKLTEAGEPVIPFFKELIKPSLTLSHTGKVLESYKLGLEMNASL
ncbi:MAG: NADH:flavin oxidoreductase [Dyadobacter sp.]|uniref:oxidoreductase n=1 Tax=Dyadobacter sp. TaxID=1914288 RepID=UPI003263AF95